MIREPALATIAGLGLEPVDEIDDVIEAAAGAGTDTASGDSDGKMGFSGARASDQDGVALLSDEAAAGEVANQRFIDRRALEPEAVEILGKRHLGDRKLVPD
jgi:hypothetical protein